MMLMMTMMMMRRRRIFLILIMMILYIILYDIYDTISYDIYNISIYIIVYNIWHLVVSFWASRRRAIQTISSQVSISDLPSQGVKVWQCIFQTSPHRVWRSEKYTVRPVTPCEGRSGKFDQSQASTRQQHWC